MTAPNPGSTRKSILRFGWVLIYGALLAFLAFLLVVAIAPGYMSPNSRSWSQATGYPALRRMLGLSIPVPVARVSPHALDRVVSSEGTLQYMNEVPVNVDVVGIVTSLGIESGKTVKRGELLATMDAGGFQVRQYAANVDQKLATYNDNKHDYERQKDAYKRGLVAQAVFETSEKNYLVSQGELQQAREKLAQAMVSMSQKVFGGEVDDPPDTTGEKPLRIVAPISGQVARVNIYVGQTIVNSGQTLMSIGDKLMFRATVDQRDFERVRLNDTGEVRLQALSGRPLQAKVTRIDPLVASQQDQQKTGQPQGTFYIWMTLDDPKVDVAAGLMSGMMGYCIITHPFVGLAVPESALLRFSGGEGTVLVVNAQNRIEVVPVQYSVDEHGWVGITSDLPEGTQVVLNGEIGLRAGDRVDPQ